MPLVNIAKLVTDYERLVASFGKPLPKDGICPVCGARTFCHYVHIGGESVHILVEDCTADRMTAWCGWQRRLTDWRGLRIAKSTTEERE